MYSNRNFDDIRTNTQNFVELQFKDELVVEEFTLKALKKFEQVIRKKWP